MSAEFEDQDPLLLVFAASADPDTIYLHKAMKQPDKSQFKQAMKEDLLMQTIIGNCFSDPNSRKESLFYLQYGRCNANAESPPKIFTSGRHAWILMEVSR